MTLASATLRVLLVLALLMNGMAGATAAPGRAGMPDVVPSGCHDQAVMASHHADMGRAHDTCSPTQHPDHCTPDHCRCACMPSLQATTSLAAWLPVPSNRSHGLPAALPAHADPALPHLIRPPIG